MFLKSTTTRRAQLGGRNSSASYASERHRAAAMPMPMPSARSGRDVARAEAKVADLDPDQYLFLGQPLWTAHPIGAPCDTS